MVVGRYILMRVSSMASMEYALGYAIEMTELVCCVDASFLRW